MPRVRGNFLLFKGESKADLHFVERSEERRVGKEC